MLIIVFSTLPFLVLGAVLARFVPVPKRFGYDSLAKEIEAAEKELEALKRETDSERAGKQRLTLKKKHEGMIHRIRRILRRQIAFVTIVLFVMCVGVMIFQGIIGQAILIWRVFNVDVNICAPYLTENEEKQLRARFAAVKTRTDYQVIDEELNRIARKNSITLREEPLW
jgi:hypothetical protein